MGDPLDGRHGLQGRGENVDPVEPRARVALLGLRGWNAKRHPVETVKGGACREPPHGAEVPAPLRLERPHRLLPTEGPLGNGPDEHCVRGAGQFVEGNILSPKLVGDSVGLHPVWLMFALVAFGSLFGFVGLLLAVPLAAAVGVLVRFALKQYLASPLYDPALAPPRDSGRTPLP